MAALIHPTAIVDPSARLAANVTIGPFCLIEPDVEIGEGTTLRSHVVVERHTRIGCDNVIFQFATIGGTPQDRKFAGEVSRCEIGDRNTIRESVTIHRGTANGGGLTVIGSDNLIMAGAHVAHDCRIDDHCTIANEAMIAGHVRLCDRASIGGGAGLHHFVTVGRLAFVAAMASVERDVPPFMIVHGTPAAVRAPNRLGLQKWGYETDQIEHIQTAFRRLFGTRDERAGIPAARAIADLRSEYADSPEVLEICDVLERSMEHPKGRALELGRRDDKRSAIRVASGATAAPAESQD